MTRSARRANSANAAAHNVSSSEHKCLECKGDLVQTRGATHICTRCGLIQDVDKGGEPGWSA
ncbi:MAG: hypothetical protein JW839_06710 [Candidatus Lokiarchaeota archaeon]|nr:hypothetical protein [Candidatus Lokiarchaeota archaeon]